VPAAEETDPGRKNWRCRTLVHSGIFCLHQAEKEDDGDTPGPTGTLCGNSSE
jgi:hypothetical protein